MRLPAVRIVRRPALVNLFSADSFGHPKPFAFMTSFTVMRICVAKRTPLVVTHRAALDDCSGKVFNSQDRANLPALRQALRPDVMAGGTGKSRTPCMICVAKTDAVTGGLG